MKPEINKTLQTLAQELIQRFSPLLKDEYEQSRLNSWGTLLLLASMDLDEAVAVSYTHLTLPTSDLV